MFQHLVVPVDGSAASWSAVPIAARMAAAVDGKLDVVTVVDRLADIVPARDELNDGVGALGDLPVDPVVHVLANDVVAKAVADHVEGLNGATVVLSSHGHGRSAAVLGSTTDELLRRLFGPIVVIGPHVDVARAGALDGAYLVPLDGSPASEQILPIAEAWAIEFGAVPWLVEVIAPSVHVTADVFESAYPARLATRLHQQTGHEVEYEVLHGDKPSRAIVEFASGNHSSLIFATTHGRTGLDRLRLGSVAAEVVRHAPCPVVLYRPPHLSA
ncbi:MAG TPA: universal stress protein [Ilumatobacter sp.]|nr:universal stress protein [Ilumatobacter sp.]